MKEHEDCLIYHSASAMFCQTLLTHMVQTQSVALYFVF